MPRDKKNGERQKKDNLEAYRKKELDRMNAYKKKTEPTYILCQAQRCSSSMERRKENRVLTKVRKELKRSKTI